MSAGLHTVHVRVNDAATGKPTPVRLRLADPAGNYYPPFGRLAEFATGRNQDVGGNLLLGARPYAYIEGACEVGLPAGPVLIDLWKGPEYRPRQAEVSLGPGQLALRLAVERWVNLREQGWYSGDTRCHALTPHAALLEAAGEDLAVVNLLAAETRVEDQFHKSVPAVPNLLAFSGQKACLEAPGHMVVVNTHNTHPVLGSLSLLNCHRVVYPLTFGGPGGRDDWTLHDWCGQCHRKGGLVVWTRAGQEGPDLALAEPLADALLGAVDAFEIDAYEDSPFDVLADWYALLGCGVRLPLVGGSGKDSNGVPLGAMRTYARLPAGEGLTYQGWVEAVRGGRTIVTNGPLLWFTVNGQDPGAVLDVAGAGQAVRVRAEARSIVPFEHLELVAGGEVVGSAPASGSPSAAVLEADWPVAAGGWLAARCRGGQTLPQRPAPQRVFAHTSPVYTRVAGQPPRADEAARRRFLGHLDRMLEWVAREARCATEPQRERLAGVFRAAREELTRRGPV
jgi:hypothetical protein